LNAALALAFAPFQLLLLSNQTKHKKTAAQFVRQFFLKVLCKIFMQINFKNSMVIFWKMCYNRKVYYKSLFLETA
jgi:hypothetical protein